MLSQLESEPEVPQIGKAPEEVPFALPRKWKWIQLENLFLFIDYRGKTPTKSECGIRLITASNVKKGYIDHQRVEYVSLSEYESRQSRGISKKGDILFTTEAPLGNAALADLDTYSAGQRVITLRSSNNLMLHEFAVYEILSSFFQKILKDNATGTTAKGIKAARLKKLWIPVPSLEEQARIVAKIRLLFGQMNHAEKAYRELSGPLSERFRQLCLEKAIQGKLVPQLESEPEVAQIGETPDDVPFSIPKKWKWCNFGNVVMYGKCEQVQPQNIEKNAWILDLEDIESGTGKLLQKKKAISVQSNKTRFKKGDVLYSKLRPYLNKVIVADDDGYCTTEIVPISLSIVQAPLNAQYLKVYLMSPYFVSYANQCSYGVKMPRLGTKDAQKALFPIPPIEEQRRIVAKLNELLPLIQQLYLGRD